LRNERKMEIRKLFEPITINQVEIKNRIVMPAMALNYTNDYSLTERFKAFYRERAHGGVGLMTIGPLAVDRVGSMPGLLSIFRDEDIGPIKSLVEELHRETDVKLGTQLFHQGRVSLSFLYGETPIGPSAVPSKLTRVTPREMTREDIEAVLVAFGQAARRAREAGFDYIEVVGCTSYLIAQFLSPLSNRRTDEYGGSPENRMRFGLEVMARMREAVGDGAAVGMRIAGNDFMDGGNTNIEAARFAVELEKAGADAINVVAGWHESNVPMLTTIVPNGAFTYLARGIKEKVAVPVFASNRLGNPYQAERALRSGASDMICWARPLIADPELPSKIKESRWDEIIYCISCNQACFDAIFGGEPVGCILNPRAGRENDLTIKKSHRPKRIFVAGGGPAGMEFALTAAQRGHEVSLYEKEDQLGGQVNLAKASPGKRELQCLIDSMAGRMKHFGVQVKLGTILTPDRVQAESPDALVVTTGARPLPIDVPGVSKSHVVNAWDVLSEKVFDIGKNVVIVGGSATGCETALFIAEMGILDWETFAFLMYHAAEEENFAKKLLHNPGKNITVIDMVDRLAENVGRSVRWSLLKSLRLKGVHLRSQTKLVEITDDAVIVQIGDKFETIPADTVVLAVGAMPVNDLASQTHGSVGQVITIGDAGSPGKITEAVHQGFEEALKV